MARFSAGARTSAGSTTLPIASLYAAASVGGIIREIGVFNTTATAVALVVQRLFTAGTKPAAATDGEFQLDGPTASCTFHGTHTAGPTITAGELRRASLGAAIGSGVIWTFGENGLILPPGTSNGVGIIVATGTGQVCDVYIEWDE